MVLVAAQLSVPGLYLPPVFERHPEGTAAPDDHFTAGPHCCVTASGSGALVVLVAVQLSVLGSYLPPVSKCCACIFGASSPNDHFAAAPHCCVMRRPAGALMVLVAVQLSVLGLYLPPVLK